MNKPMVIRAKEAIRLLRRVRAEKRSLKEIHRTVDDYKDAVSIAIDALKHMMMAQCDKPFFEKEIKRHIGRPAWIRFLENGNSTEHCPNGRWVIVEAVNAKEGTVTVSHLGTMQLSSMSKTWQMFSGYVPKGAPLSLHKRANDKKRACWMPSDAEWGFACEVPVEHKAVTVQIGFSHREFEGDETEFCVVTQDSKTELDDLFGAFCEENGYKDVRIDYVTVVRSAIDMDALVRIEEEM